MIEVEADAPSAAGVPPFGAARDVKIFDVVTAHVVVTDAEPATKVTDPIQGAVVAGREIDLIETELDVFT